MLVNFKLNESNITIDWNDETVKEKLEGLAQAKKNCHWIQADLSLANSSFLTRLAFRIAKCVNLHRWFGQNFLKVELGASHHILKHLQKHVAEDDEFSLLFTRAIANYNLIVSDNYQLKLPSEYNPEHVERNPVEQNVVSPTDDTDLEKLSTDECDEIVRTHQPERLREILHSALCKLQWGEVNYINDELYHNVQNLFAKMNGDQLYVCLPVFLQDSPPEFPYYLWGLSLDQFVAFSVRLAKENPQQFMKFHCALLENPDSQYKEGIKKKDILESMYASLPDGWFDDTERNFTLLQMYEKIDIVEAQPLLRRLNKIQLVSLSKKSEASYLYLREIAFAAHTDNISQELVEILLSSTENRKERIAYALLENLQSIPPYAILKAAFASFKQEDMSKLMESYKYSRRFIVCIQCYLLSTSLKTNKQNVEEVLKEISTKEELVVQYAIANFEIKEFCLLLQGVERHAHCQKWGVLFLSAILKGGDADTIEWVFRTYWPIRRCFNRFLPGVTECLIPLIETDKQKRALEKSLLVLPADERAKLFEGLKRYL